VTLEAAIRRLESCVDDDEIFTLQRPSRGSWEAWSYAGEVGRGEGPTAAVLELAGKLQ
jgi:hypothetical protein